MNKERLSSKVDKVLPSEARLLCGDKSTVLIAPQAYHQSARMARRPVKEMDMSYASRIECPTDVHRKLNGGILQSGVQMVSIGSESWGEVERQGWERNVDIVETLLQTESASR